MFLRSLQAVGREITRQLDAHLKWKAAADADMLQCARSVIKSQQQRSDGGLGDLAIPSEARHHAIAIEFMFDFEHDSLVRLVYTISWFRHDSIQACSFEAAKPIFCNSGIVRCWRDV